MDQTLSSERPEIPDGYVSAILTSLEGRPGATAEFLEGLDKHLHRVSMDISGDATGKLLRYLTHWGIDVILTQRPAWREQVEESEAAVQDGKLGEPVGAEELRRQLLQHS
jgi:hypothetical protein